VKGLTMPNERRNNKRLKFGYYMRVIDNNSQELLGNLSDISPRGFRLDSQKALTINQDYTLRLEQTSMVSDKPYIVFNARAMWGQRDPIIPNEYNEGFQIINISQYEEEIFQSVMEKYGVPENQ
jgi:hypothetical protein